MDGGNQILVKHTAAVHISNVLTLNQRKITNILLKNDLRILNTTQLEWNILKRDRKRSWAVSTILASAKIENGTVLYSYSSALRQALYNPNIYAKLDLVVQQQIKNKHSIVLWEYIMCELSAVGKRQMTTKWISLDDLRKILGLQNSKTYNSFNALHRLLKLAIDEINQKSLTFFWSFKKNRERFGLCVLLLHVMNKFLLLNTKRKLNF